MVDPHSLASNNRPLESAPAGKVHGFHPSSARSFCAIAVTVIACGMRADCRCQCRSIAGIRVPVHRTPAVHQFGKPFSTALHWSGTRMRSVQTVLVRILLIPTLVPNANEAES